MNYLVGDIGNTLTKIALLNNKFKIIKFFNIQTSILNNKKNKNIFLKKILKYNFNKDILFSSVVPLTFKTIKKYMEKKKFKVFEIKNLNLKNIIKIKINRYNQLGSDRIANAVGAFYKIKQNCLIIDFGTATTFDIVKKPGTYEGGIIAPGINSSINNLSKNTALLPFIKLKFKSKIYGKNTKDAINAGFIWGYQGLINNIIKKINKTEKFKYKVVLTGGYSKSFKRFLGEKTIVDEDITIKGIIRIYKELLL